MYSVMLAAMLTTTSATPDWGCHGCYGCSSCCSCVGYYGYNAFSSCYSCCGCSGYYSGGGCYGCYGCCGGFFGSMSFTDGPHFETIGCQGCHGGWFVTTRCHGCCGGCYGPVVVTPPTPRVMTFSVEGMELKIQPEKPRAGMGTLEERLRALEQENRALRERLRSMEGGRPEKPGKPRKPPKPEDITVPTPAHVVVKLPAEARLLIDETRCPLTSATRSFDTPALEPGQAYYYTLTAETVRDGRTVTARRKVTVRAGAETVVDFGAMQNLVSAAR